MTVRVLQDGEHLGLSGSITVLNIPDSDPIAFADGQGNASADWIAAVMEDL